MNTPYVVGILLRDKWGDSRFLCRLLIFKVTDNKSITNLYDDTFSESVLQSWIESLTELQHNISVHNSSLLSGSTKNPSLDDFCLSIKEICRLFLSRKRMTPHSFQNKMPQVELEKNGHTYEATRRRQEICQNKLVNCVAEHNNCWPKTSQHLPLHHFQTRPKIERFDKWSSSWWRLIYRHSSRLQKAFFRLGCKYCIACY